jgi:hypothetical protein
MLPAVQSQNIDYCFIKYFKNTAILNMLMWYTALRTYFRDQQALPHSVQQLHVQQPSTHAKPEAASEVLDS